MTNTASNHEPEPKAGTVVDNVGQPTPRWLDPKMQLWAECKTCEAIITAKDRQADWEHL
jgi:hypothetical protein